MRDKIQETFSQFTAAVKETLTDLSDSAKEKSKAVIDDWLNVFPQLEGMGLEMTSFGMALAISPSMDVEFKGSGSDFDEEALDRLKEEHKGNSHVLNVLRVIRLTRKMHLKMGKDASQEMYVKIRVRVPPEIRVYYGQPVIL
ncbi:MAG: hypothetical protein R3330_12510 [Saprospiraceae bacterium]|nr:hypothetical protein [Saprospiraceae bacterium]